MPVDSSELRSAIWTPHGFVQAERRSISEEMVRMVLDKPDGVFPVRPGRVVAQRRTTISEKQYLLRVFVDVDREPPEIVTVYRTSKLEKYEVSP